MKWAEEIQIHNFGAVLSSECSLDLFRGGRLLVTGSKKLLDRLNGDGGDGAAGRQLLERGSGVEYRHRAPCDATSLTEQGKRQH